MDATVRRPGGRVESGTETENNAGAVIEEQLSRSSYRGAVIEELLSRNIFSRKTAQTELIRASLTLYTPACTGRRRFTVKDISHRSDDDSATGNYPEVERFTKNKITKQRSPDQLQK